jgi:hypothetical protein
MTLLNQMMSGYAHSDAALSCGKMLRACAALPVLNEALLVGPDGGLSTDFIALLTTHVRNANFEVAADAFETLKQLLRANKALVFSIFNPDGEPASRLQCVQGARPVAPLRRLGTRPRARFVATAPLTAASPPRTARARAATTTSSSCTTRSCSRATTTCSSGSRCSC